MRQLLRMAGTSRGRAGHGVHVRARAKLPLMHRSEITIDLGALRRNVRTLLRALDGAELWAVVKADGYGHGAADREIARARDAGLELAVSERDLPEGVPLHLELESGMGRYGLAELPELPVDVVGLMSHFASADCDAAFTERQIERFRAATDGHAHLTRHIANSAGALRYPAARFDAARCGIALYGLSPFGADPVEDGLEPVLHWS